MYAVVQIGSSQIKVSEGDTIEANRLDQEAGKSITLDKVLMYANGSDIRVGQPFLKDVKVTAKVLQNFRGDKLIAFKFQKRKGYKRKVGHRQELSAINIVKIAA